LKQHLSRFDEDFSDLFDQTKHAKLQWLPDPSQMNGDNLTNVKSEASIHSRKNIEIEESNKNKNIRDL
jgi:hypothetical protein